MFRIIAAAAIAAHLAYLGFLAVGGLLAWRYSRLLRLHLLAMVWAAVSLIIRVDCPLTDVQKWAIRRSGHKAYAGGFIDHYLTGTLYPRGWKVAVGVAVGAVVVAGYVGLWIRKPDALRLALRR